MKKEVKKMPRNKYPEETKNKILETALKLFVEVGYDETTVLDIIANLNGLTRGAFYHHFKSKEAVLEELFKIFVDGGAATPFEAAMRAKVPNGLARLKLAMKQGLESNIASSESIALVSMGMALLMKPRFFAERHKMNLQIAKYLEPMIKEGIADGSIKKGNVKVMAELVILLINHWLVPNFFPCTEEEFHAKGEMIRHILEGVGLPVIDDEITELYLNVIKELKW
jgi:AcrR family transcriptional regulator